MLPEAFRTEKFRTLIALALSVGGLGMALPQILTLPLALAIAGINFFLLPWMFASPTRYQILLISNFIPLIFMKALHVGNGTIFQFGFTLFVLQLTSFLVDKKNSEDSEKTRLEDFLLYLFYLPKFFVGS